MVCTMEEPPVRPSSHKVGEDGLRNYINKPEGGRAASFLKMTNIKNRPITIIISTTIGGNINIFGLTCLHKEMIFHYQTFTKKHNSFFFQFLNSTK